MTEFDYIIAGAGSAGCVLANRLSADPAVSVCLIEGGDHANRAQINVPGMFGLNMFLLRNNWAFQSEPDKATGKSQFVPRGKGLGGSSSLNGMVYIRGHARDYDHWAQLGNTGWSYDEVLPYFKKAERNERGGDAYHGGGGPLHVSDPGAVEYPMDELFLQACEQAGYRRTDDFNGPPEKFEGFGRFQFTIRDGRRFSTKHAYLDPVMGRPNLQIVTECMVEKVLVHQGRATGVALRRDGRPETLTARREVLVCGGAIGSPKLLLQSGIGDGDELHALGVEPVHELKGVGKNLQEHADFALNYTSKQRDGFSVGPRGLARITGKAAAYFAGQHGNAIGRSITDAGGFLKSDARLEIPDLQVHFLPLVFDDHGRDLKKLAQHGFSAHVCMLHPESRGWVTLNSADPADPPKITLNLLDAESDLDAICSGVAQLRTIFGQPVLKDHVLAETKPGPDVQSTETLKEVIRREIAHVYHPVGTCQMGVHDTAVVTPDLKVRGLEGLRVVDASVMPVITSGNTNAPTIMIAEKAADMILRA